LAKKGGNDKPKVVKAANNNKTGAKLTQKKTVTTKAKTVPVKVVKQNNNNNNNPKTKKVLTVKTVKTVKTAPKTTPKNNQKAATPKGGKPATPTTPKSKLESALETARAVARNKNHFNHTEIKSLLESFEKGWTSKEKFLQLLPGLLGLK
jgi:hypothetical protein